MYLLCHVSSHDHFTEGLWEFLVLCYHGKNSCYYKHYDSGDIMFLVSYVTSRKQMLKGLCEFMGRSPSLRVTTLPCLASIGLVQVET